MKKIEKPKISVREMMTNISETVRDITKKNNIINAIDRIEQCTDDYDNLAESQKLHLISASQDIETSLDAEDMKKLYTEKVAGNLKEKYYDKLLSLATSGLCPICGISQVSNLDHYLAKSIYPTYSITPYNLTPICRDCNYKKRDKQIIKYSDGTYHPYYDNIDDNIWLSAKLLKVPEQNIVVNYYVNDEIKLIDNENYLKLVNHCTVFKLFDLYSKQASSEITNNLHFWKKQLNTDGEDAFKSYLVECLKSREVHQKNTWYTALLRALIDNVNIII